MNTANSLIRVGMVSCALLFSGGCDKDLDAGDPAETAAANEDSDAPVSANESSDAPEDTRSVPANESNSGAETPAGTTGDTQEGDSTGTKIEASEFFFRADAGWPAFHLAVDGDSTELTFAVSEAFYSETGGWDYVPDSAILAQTATFEDDILYLEVQGVPLDGVPGFIMAQMTLADDVLCGTLTYAYSEIGKPPAPVAASGFRVDADVDPSVTCTE